MKKALFVLAVLAISQMAHASDRHDESDIRGIYVVGGVESPFPDANATALAASLDIHGVDGLELVVGWDDIEPARGKYAWDETDQNPLDQWLSMAISRGKKIELSILAFRTPEWLFHGEAGFTPARKLTFTYPHRNSDCSDPKTEKIAAPWDPAFLNEWDAMLAKVANHLKKTEAYDDIPILRLTGINLDSDELHLPSNQSAPAPCTNAVDTWRYDAQPPYRPSRLLEAWDAITSSFRRSFPDKYFSVAIIDSTNPFPPIDDNGNIITDTHGLSPIQNQPLLKLARLKFPGRLVIQNNSLYPPDPAQPETIDFAQSLETFIAFQTNEDIDYANTGMPNVVGKGAGCGERSDPPTPCTDAATFLKMLDTGIYPLGKDNCLRAQYIEVFVPNVIEFPDATRKAHQELTTGRDQESHGSFSCYSCEQTPGKGDTECHSDH